VVASFALIAFSLAALVVLARALVASSYAEALVLSFVAAFTFVVVSVEVLAAFHSISTGALAWLWVLVALAAAAALLRFRPKLIRPHIGRERLVGAVTASLIFIISGFIALAFAPSGADGATYRLPRVMQWLQNQDLSAFPTIVERQIYIPPAADYWLAHVIGVSNSDIWVNAPQFLAGFVVVIAAGALAFNLSGSNQAWNLSVILSVTTPVLLSQLVSVQSDLISAALVISGLYVVVVTATEHLRLAAVTLGVICALAAGAKATGALLLIPIVVYFIWANRGELRRVLPPLGLAALGGFALAIAPHLSRLQSVYGVWIPKSENYLNAPFSLEVAVLNVPRNFVSLFSPPLQGLNKTISDWINEFSGAIFGSDAAQTGVWGDSLFALNPWFSEDYVSAPLHALLALVFVVLALVNRARGLGWLALVVVAQILVVGVSLLWQPWINRFTFIIAIAGCVGFAAYIGERVKWLRVSLASLAVVIALPLLVYPKGREWLPSPGLPVLGLSSFPARVEIGNRNYFTAESTEIRVAEFVAQQNPGAVRLYLPGYGKDGIGSAEYPWWAELRNRLPQVRIEHARSIPPMTPTTTPVIDTLVICVEACPNVQGERLANFDGVEVVR
jgi:hypothetical protein